MSIRRIRLQRLQSQLGEVAYQFTKLHFSEFQSAEPTWQPAINAYRCARCIRICVDLAGVDQSTIDLQIEPGRLHIRGRREMPGPPPEETWPGEAPHSLQAIALEIDHGPFERELVLPLSVAPERVTAEQANGLLWIHLPLRCEA